MPIPQAASGLLDAMRGTPQRMLNAVDGNTIGHKVLEMLGIPLGENPMAPSPGNPAADQLSQQMNQNAVNRAAASHVDPRTQVPRIRR